MSWLAAHIRGVAEWAIAWFDVFPAPVALTAIAILSGAAMLWVIGRASPQERILHARAQIAAAVYEMRLFLDSPGRVLLAQGRLLGWFFRYLLYLLPAFLLLSVPCGLLLLHLETRHGLRPLPVDAPVVVRVDLAAGIDGYRVTASSLDPDEPLRVTAPPLYLERAQRVYLRVLVRAPGEHRLAIDTGTQVVEKRLSAGSHAPVRAERRSGLASWWQRGDEAPLPSGGDITAVRIAHPVSNSAWLGFDWLPWWGYWLLVSTATALLLRRPMRVTL